MTKQYILNVREATQFIQWIDLSIQMTLF